MWGDYGFGVIVTQRVAFEFTANCARFWRIAGCGNPVVVAFACISTGIAGATFCTFVVIAPNVRFVCSCRCATTRTCTIVCAITVVGVGNWVSYAKRVFVGVNWGACFCGIAGMDFKFGAAVWCKIAVPGASYFYARFKTSKFVFFFVVTK